MRTLVVWAHPSSNSFSAALLERAVQALRSAGHHVDVIDLYAEGFRPAMPAAEWLAYRAFRPEPDESTQRHIELVRVAAQIVFIYPTWWFGLPACLKGWLERTMIPGVAFDFNDAGRIEGSLGSLRRIVGISTYGSAPWYVHLIGDAGRRTLTRCLRLSASKPWRVRTTWLALYRMDTASDHARQAFLDRITKTLGPTTPIATPPASRRPEASASERPNKPEASASERPNKPEASASERPNKPALVVYAHPHAESFAGSARDRVVTTLRDRGHDVSVIDLYAEHFNPLLSAEELRDHRVGVSARPSVARHGELLRRAEVLVFVYPTWWGGQPAMLKGWFDRVWCEGVAYTLPDGATRVRPLLGNVRHLVVVTTCGSPRWINALQGEGGKRTVRWGLRTLMHPRTRTSWMCLYSMDRNNDDDRRRFLDEVAKRLQRLGN